MKLTPMIKTADLLDMFEKFDEGAMFVSGFGDTATVKKYKDTGAKYLQISVFAGGTLNLRRSKTEPIPLPILNLLWTRTPLSKQADDQTPEQTPASDPVTHSDGLTTSEMITQIKEGEIYEVIKSVDGGHVYYGRHVDFRTPVLKISNDQDVEVLFVINKTTLEHKWRKRLLQVDIHAAAIALKDDKRVRCVDTGRVLGPHNPYAIMFSINEVLSQWEILD